MLLAMPSGIQKWPPKSAPSASAAGRQRADHVVGVDRDERRARGLLPGNDRAVPVRLGRPERPVAQRWRPGGHHPWQRRWRSARTTCRSPALPGGHRADRGERLRRFTATIAARPPPASTRSWTRYRELLRAAGVLYADETPARAAGHLHYVHAPAPGTAPRCTPVTGREGSYRRRGVLPGYAGTIVRTATRYMSTSPTRCTPRCGAHGLRDLAGLYRFDPDGQLWPRAMADLLIDANAAATAARSAGRPARRGAARRHPCPVPRRGRQGHHR